MEKSKLEINQPLTSQQNTSLSSSSSSIVSSSSRSNSKSPDLIQVNDEKSLIKIFNDKVLLNNNQDDDESTASIKSNISTSKRSNVKTIIANLYDLNRVLQIINNNEENEDLNLNTLIEGYLDMLPNGRNQKNSILLTWKKRYLKLHLGSLYIYEDKAFCNNNKIPLNVYNLMGGKFECEDNRVLCIDDSRGNCIVVRCSDDAQYIKWKSAIELQIIDRAHSLWIKPKFSNKTQNTKNNQLCVEKVCALLKLFNHSI